MVILFLERKFNVEIMEISIVVTGASVFSRKNRLLTINL